MVAQKRSRGNIFYYFYYSFVVISCLFLLYNCIKVREYKVIHSLFVLSLSSCIFMNGIFPKNSLQLYLYICTNNMAEVKMIKSRSLFSIVHLFCIPKQTCSRGSLIFAKWGYSKNAAI